jgi:tetratricopeptide (TPR) repeat protein
MASIGLSFLWTGALASPENITDGELALTPPYCQDVQTIRYGDATTNTSPRAKYWVSLMGKSFWALHHYCWGLINLRRAQMPGVRPEIKTGLLTSVANDYMYVIHNSTPDFVLLPEIYTRLGEVQLLRSLPGQADEAFEQARRLKPDYWPAYSRWADVLIRAGQKSQARQLVEEGLRQAPDAKALRDQYRKLGGDPDEVASLAKATPPAANAGASEPAASAPNAGGTR